jgi:hypothetical protein
VHQQHGRDAGEMACGVALLAGEIHGSDGWRAGSVRQAQVRDESARL